MHLKIPAKYQISVKLVRRFANYEHLKFRPMHGLKYRLLGPNDVIAVSHKFSFYHCVEHIKPNIMIIEAITTKL